GGRPSVGTGGIELVHDGLVGRGRCGAGIDVAYGYFGRLVCAAAAEGGEPKTDLVLVVEHHLVEGVQRHVPSAGRSAAGTVAGLTPVHTPRTVQHDEHVWL